MPSRARRSRDCCCVSARTRDLKPLKIMGSGMPRSEGNPAVQFSDGRITVGDNDAVFSLNGFIGNGFGEIDGEEDRVHLATNWVKWSFKEDCDNISALYPNLGAPATHGRYYQSFCPPMLPDIYSKQISATRERKHMRPRVQLAHCRYHSCCERRRLICSIGAHLCCVDEGSTQHEG